MTGRHAATGPAAGAAPATGQPRRSPRPAGARGRHAAPAPAPDGAHLSDGAPVPDGAPSPDGAPAPDRTRASGTARRPAAPHPLTGVGALTRLALRRDRLFLPLWLLGIGAFVPYVFAAYTTLFPTDADLAGVVTMLSGPIGSIMGGPGYGMDASVTYAALFAAVYWLYLMLILGLFHAFLVPRHTRAGEESGRAELLLAARVARRAPVLAALLVALLADVLVGLAVFGGLLAFDADPASAALLAVGTTVFGLVFAGVAALAAQVSGSARGAAGLAGAVLALAFVVRGIGDTMVKGGSWVSWLSPFAWAQQTRAFVDDRWWPVAIGLVAAVLLAATAVALAARRDVGAGLVVARRGRPAARPWLAGPVSLAARLQSGALRWWAVGLVAAALAYGALTGVVVDSLDALPPELSALFGGATGATTGYVEFTVFMVAMVAAAAGLSAVSHARAEETGVRAALVLATATSRTRWFLGHIGVIALAVLAILVVVGLTAGASARAAVGDDAGFTLGEAVAASLVTAPAAWALLGLGACLLGWAPRLLPLMWLPMVLGFLIETFGTLIRVPDVVHRLSPWEYTPRLLTGEMDWVPVIVQLAVAVVLVAAGVVGFRRRDIED